MIRCATIISLLSCCLLLNAQQPFQRARQAMDAGEWKVAGKLLDSCERKNHFSDSTFFYRAMLLARTGELRQAKKSLHLLGEKYPAFAELDFLKGLISFSETSYARSIDEFTKTIDRNPLHYRAIYNRSLAYGMLDEYLFAIEDLGRLIAINPSDAKIYYARAYWYEFTGNYTESARDYSEVILLDSRNYDAYLGLAFSYRQLGEREKSCEVIAKAIKAGSQVAEELRANYCE